MDNLRMFYLALDCNVVILSYRGYGESESVPSEDGLYLDAEAILQWLLGRDDLDRSRIVLFGRSLGGGVAIDLAAKHEESGENGGLSGTVAAVIVENSFASISNMVDCVFPYLSFVKPFILRMKWDSINKIVAISKPILFVSGAQVRDNPQTTAFLAFSSFFLLSLFYHGTEQKTLRCIFRINLRIIGFSLSPPVAFLVFRLLLFCFIARG
jgi:fermentation-respiration switch protein FrsA (DUF1100 family)